MKVLVTGAAGFIGFHLAQKLLERGDEVIGIDNINNYYDIDLKYARLQELGIARNQITEQHPVPSQRYPHFHFLKCDLTDRIAMEALFSQGFDAVMHLAAQAGVRYSLENPYIYIESNIIGFLNILEGCRQHHIKNLAFASSSSVYGLNRSQPFHTSDHTDHPVSLYAATKKSNEMMAHTYAHLYGIRTTGLRFFTVYGPWGRPDMAPMLFADAILHKKAIKVFNHGDMSRDFTYIDDIVQGCLKVLDNPASPSEQWDPEDPDPAISSAPYQLYNIGKNEPVALNTFIKILEKHLGQEAEKEYLPMQPGDVASTYADVSGLIQTFEYQPSTDLDTGIKSFVQWYLSFYHSL